MISRVDFGTVYAPYFLDKEEEDDFYLPAQMPNDIWKKFELLPTPPLSPRRDTDDAYGLLDAAITATHLQPDLFDEKYQHPPEKILYPESPPPSLVSCQDPMWSGHVMDGEIQRYSEQQRSFEVKPPPTVRTSTPSVGLGPNESDCIDPQSVFAYNLQETTTEPPYRHMGTDTPSDSEEEIDVVSVNKIKLTVPQTKKTVMSSSLLSHALSDVRNTHNYSKPHIHVSYTSNKNTHKRTMKFVVPSHSLLKRNNKSTDTCGDAAMSTKRPKRESILLDMENVMESWETEDSRTCITRKKSTRGSLDSCDDSEQVFAGGSLKRNQHNVLERKRRNDLKSSYYTLRDEVPELVRLERAPKVMILQKAQEYITDLQESQFALKKEVEKQKTTRVQLLKKLHRLQGLHEDFSDVEM